MAFQQRTANSSLQNNSIKDSTRLARSANSLVQSTYNEHNNLEVQINSRFGQNLSTLTCLVPLCSQLSYRKSSIVYLEVKLGGHRVNDKRPAETSRNQWQNSRFSSQQQNGRTSAKPKPRTLTFCTWKSCACPTCSLPVDCAQVVQLPALPTEKQSKASIIQRPPFPTPKHALFRWRTQTQVPTTRNYTLELPTFGVIARVNPIQVQ